MNMRVIFTILISLVIGFFGGYPVFHSDQRTQSSPQNCQNNYHFINNGLACDPDPAIGKQEYTEFVDQLTQYINDQTNKKNAIEVGVYFRDLYAGPTFGINSDAKFAPASLLKLPLLITYLSFADQYPAVLSKTLSYTNSGPNAQQIPQQSENGIIPTLAQNQPYTIDDLLSRMIIYSDNVSYYILNDYLTQVSPSGDTLTQTMIDLGLVNPNNPNENTMTVKAYASIFRQLYNSSYLSPQMSEKALSLMSQTNFKKGLVAGVPSNVKVAHKYGERSGLPNGEKQLHDCGIVYYPNNPYLLCVMTRGTDFSSLQNIIKTISQKMYQEVNSRKQ